MFVREAGGDLKDLLSKGINRFHVRRNIVEERFVENGYKIRRGSPSPAVRQRGFFPSPPLFDHDHGDDNSAIHYPAMSSNQPPAITTILTSSGNGEESVVDIPASENLGNLTPSARTSRTRVDLLTVSPPGEITTAAPSIQDEEGNATPAQEPLREEARAEPMVSLTILVLSGDRKKFTFHPDTTAGRVKEMIWSTWDASVSRISP